jgi:hypothetical protein
VPRYYCTAVTVRVVLDVRVVPDGVVLVTAGSSLGAHGWLLMGWALLADELTDELLDRGDVDRTGQAQRPDEGPPLVGECHALQVVVHGGTTARQSAGSVGDEDALHRDDPQQGGLSRSDPAPHASADRVRETDR